MDPKGLEHFSEVVPPCLLGVSRESGSLHFTWNQTGLAELFQCVHDCARSHELQTGVVAQGPSRNVTINYTDVTITYTDVTLNYTDVTITCTDVTLNYTDVTINYTEVTINCADVMIKCTDLLVFCRS